MAAKKDKVLNWRGEEIKDGVDCSVEPSMTQQQFGAECDINNILAKYEKTGVLPNFDERMPQYGDFTGVTDYQSAVNAVLRAEEAFLSLPAKIRDRFANDPQKFLEFMGDANNQEEWVKLGLATRKPEAAPSSDAAPVPDAAPKK